MNSSNHANDDFDVVFTGGGVSAFAFVINALDLDWTIETFDLNDNLLSSYTLASQSPGLTGYARRGYFGATESTAIQYFTVRSVGSDRAVIDDFSYVMVVPKPNTGVLLGLGLLTLAGSRFRAQSAAQAPVRSISTPPDRSDNDSSSAFLVALDGTDSLSGTWNERSCEALYHYESG